MVRVPRRGDEGRVMRLTVIADGHRLVRDLPPEKGEWQ